MAGNEARLTIRREGDVASIELLDRSILDEGNIQRLGEEILHLVDTNPHPKIVLNFRNVEHLSSAALGTLITINNRVRQKDGQLRLTNIDPQIYEVFVITKLNKLFHIHKTIEEAIASFE